MIEDIDSDVYGRIKTDQLVVGNNIVTNRIMPPTGTTGTTHRTRLVASFRPFHRRGWLRQGMEKVVQQQSGTVCDPGESNANFCED